MELRRSLRQRQAARSGSHLRAGAWGKNAALRPPRSCAQRLSPGRTWGIDKDTGQLVSLAFTGFGPEPVPTAAFYAAEAVSPSSVTFVHQKLLKEPRAPNRFTYAVDGEALRMVWEVQREGEWKMGDHLECRRAAASAH